MSEYKSIKDVIAGMWAEADERDGPTSPPMSFNEMTVEHTVARELREWAMRLELIMYGDLASAFERSKDMKRIISPTGTVHVVESEYEAGEVAPEYENARTTMCHHKNHDGGIGAYDVFWDLTEANATCKNCLRALDRSM